jgi:hypothetical protein
VSPKIPLKLGKPYYALATAHAALGTITEIAGLYILLAAGTSVLPKKFGIANYKLWMRTVLVLWWGVLLLGFASYVRWYVPPHSLLGRAGAIQPAHQELHEHPQSLWSVDTSRAFARSIAQDPSSRGERR